MRTQVNAGCRVSLQFIYIFKSSSWRLERLWKKRPDAVQATANRLKSASINSMAVSNFVNIAHSCRVHDLPHSTAASTEDSCSSVEAIARRVFEDHICIRKKIAELICARPMPESIPIMSRTRKGKENIASLAEFQNGAPGLSTLCELFFDSVTMPSHTGLSLQA